MRIALVADLHGNLPATAAVHDDIKSRGADAIWCLGDVVGKGPDSPETMDWALANCAIVLKGNWDNFIGTNEWYAAQLGEQRLRTLQSLPLEHWFTLSGRRFRLIHGRDIVPDCVYHNSPIEEQLRFFDVPGKPDIVGFADIHRPFWVQLNEAGILFNTGSVGNALGGDVFAKYTIIEGEAGQANAPLAHTIVSVAYDQDEAVRRAHERKQPQYDAFI
ncbi:MAG: metallophosphatase family protein, partial [Oscillospiraceae bacterium]|nr:metallophosphatase family protein [Oscillospiraceae bacterium]